MKKIESMIVVGGGTAGCIAALMLKTRWPNKEINLIKSSNVGIIGVGESSTEHWTEFCKFVGIPSLYSITKCKATFKTGVYFKGWADEDFMHGILPPYARTAGEYFLNYGRLISRNVPKYELQSEVTWQNRLTLNHYTHDYDSPTNQFHFDTFALNEFLIEKCKSRGIEIIEDELTDALLNDNGEIKSVISENNEYESDFFIDCTGFSRMLLHKKLGVKWKSYSEYLPLNSAIAFATEEMEEYNKYTLSTARNAGWSWTIPVQGRTGNGYVYCDRFISKDEAHREMEEAYGQKLEIAREFKFDPGRLEKAWHKNCYAVGLSQSFVEPLEATSIGSVIQQMFCFLTYLPSYDVDSCNSIVNKIFDNIVDYIQAHYLVQKENTDFWKEIKYNFKLTDSLKDLLHKWKTRLPQSIDIDCAWALFRPINYIPILYGLNWFDVEKIKEEFEQMGEIGLDDDIYFANGQEKYSYILGHKQLIKILVESDSKHD
jgi:tryptophan halogenase